VTALKTATGTSGLDDAAQAGRAAAAEAMARLVAAGIPGGEAPSLVLVYASVKYDLPELLAGVRSVTGSAPLAGSTSSGHFAAGTVAGPGEGVAVLLLSSGDYRFGVASARGMAADPEAVGTLVARGAKLAAGGVRDRPYAAMILLTDGLGGDQQAVLTGVHRVAGAAVPVVGGAAADDRQLQRTSVFHDGEVLSDAAVGIWVGSLRPLVVTSAHGWKAITLPLLITQSEGRVISEIGGRPASDVYHEFAAQALVKPTIPGGPIWQASYALGLIEPDGSHLVRGVYLTEGGPIHTFTPVAPYSAVQIMTADPESMMAVVEGVVEDALVYGDETVVLAFNCIARMDVLGDAYPEEVARMTKAAGDAVCFGMYTYGEFARSQGVGGVHNATLTTLAL
jgi:hypothetical protein